jgi:hypothetical protein
VIMCRVRRIAFKKFWIFSINISGLTGISWMTRGNGWWVCFIPW